MRVCVSDGIACHFLVHPNDFSPSAVKGVFVPRSYTLNRYICACLPLKDSLSEEAPALALTEAADQFLPYAGMNKSYACIKGWGLFLVAKLCESQADQPLEEFSFSDSEFDQVTRKIANQPGDDMLTLCGHCMCPSSASPSLRLIK